MSNLKKHSLLILLIMLIFVLVPISFAADIDSNATDNVIEDASSDIIQSDDCDVLVKNTEGIVVDEEEIEIYEGEDVSITGQVIYSVGSQSYDSLNIEYSYTDSDGVKQTGTTFYDGLNTQMFGFDISGLRASETPYVITLTAVEDELYDEVIMYCYLDPAYVYVTVKNPADDPSTQPSLPNYETFTPVGQIFVDENGNDDDNDGSEASPYATIEQALDRNKELGGNYEIVVNEGWYFFDESYTISNNVRITGRGKVEIFNAGTGGYIFFTSGTNIIEFNNLTISGGTNGAISGSTTYGGNGNEGKVLNIINCTFVDNGGDVGVITTYSKTTIIQSTFINNTANGFSGDFKGLISARDNSLTVNFCNFIGNTLSGNNPIIYSKVKTNANFNFWGTNDGPLSSDIIASDFKADRWVVIVPQLNDQVVMGSNYDLVVKFMYTNSTGPINDLNASMPNLDIKINSKLGVINPTGVIENNVSTLNYYATNKGLENITFSLSDKVITYITFNVEALELDKIYVSTTGNDNNPGNSSSPLKTIGAAIIKNTLLGGDKEIIILPGTYEEYDLEISSPVTIIGRENVVINANKKGRIFIIDSDVDIYNVTLSNAYVEDDNEYFNYGGAIYHNSGDLNIYNCEFNSNYAENTGAAIASQSTGTLGIYNSKFTDNVIGEYSSALTGIVIYSDTEMIIQGCEFTDNAMADAYGCIYVGNDANILMNTFNNNEALEGGAIYVNGGNQANILIKGNNFTSNKANKGGAVYVEVSASTVIENNNFVNNVASNGGAIYLYGMTSQNRIAGNNFTGNTNDAIYVRSAKVDLENNTITGSSPQIILDSGFIGNIILSFNQNQTLKLEDGQIQLNATVTDDMGNVINGGEVAFTCNGEAIGTSNVVNGQATLLKQLNTGNYLISGSYSGSSEQYPPSEIKDSLVRINVVNYWFIDSVGFETLQEAIDAAQINDVIQGIPGVYDEPIIQIGHRTRPSEPWVINKNITITSLGEDPIVLKASDRYIFYIDYNSNVTFKNIVLTGSNNPDGWGGAIDSMGHNTIVVENCTFRDNIAEKGAGIYGYGNLFVKDCVFINNTAAVYGGAIVKDGDGDFILENVKFINNSAFTYSGAVDCRGYSDVIQIFKNITFEGNDATCAGALYTSGKNVTFIDCVFNNNRAINKESGYDPLGGAVYVHNGATKFINTRFTNNYAEGTGGALQLENTVSSVVDSSGRHITIYWGILENCLIENNTALDDGGAIYTGQTFRTYINITDTVIRNNTAANGAIFVNLYGFYTLNNVTAENNKNTAGSSLIYTYGMYSFPESFYANTTIVDSTFKNNDAERFITTTTIYSTVNITNSVFENMGMLLYSYEGSICNLTNVRESNSKSEVSIDNTGTLSLRNNSFENPIINRATINTPTFIIVLNNQTYVYEIGEVVKLEATVVDDNNNIITGHDLVFVIQDMEIPSTFENNVYIANYTVAMGVKLIDANYTDYGLTDLLVKTATIEGKSNLVVNSPDIVAYDKLDKFNITVTNINGNPVSDVKFLISIGGTEYLIDSDINGVILIDLDLSLGIYPVNIRFDGNSKYNPVNINSTITVLSSSNITPPTPDGGIDNIKRITENKDLVMDYRDGSKFKVRIIGDDGKAVGAGEVVKFTLSGKTYNVKTDKNGYASLTIKSVPKTYKITVEYKGYKVSNKIKVKSVIKAKNISKKKAKKIKYTVKLKTSKGKALKGKKVTFKIKGKTYKSKTNKKGVAKVYLKNLKVGKHKITVKYLSSKVKRTVRIKK
ncbi:right-handed parallel beta-helix repeat-containing protein [Methanobrevibacter sp.]|uniref:right-handed parallel beta-helix repeat-containing protein n=1 Tax=Methanobrevibacter sp. TaxID=66852 RepID=UPI00386B808E